MADPEINTEDREKLISSAQSGSGAIDYKKAQCFLPFFKSLLSPFKAWAYQSVLTARRCEGTHFEMLNSSQVSSNDVCVRACVCGWVYVHSRLWAPSVISLPDSFCPLNRHLSK